MKLANKIILTGKGLHSGKDCKLVIEPYDTPVILMNNFPITKFSLNGTNRGSDYIFSGVKITVEGEEMPALDGCSRQVCDEILANSIESEEPEALKISEPVIISTDDKKRFVAAFPSDKLHISYMVEYNFVGAQLIDYEHSPKKYFDEIASARTFAMKADFDYLRSKGLALGGNLENAILIDEEIHASGGLRWPDEFVRHKVLDLIGDLTSLGKPLHAHVIALRAGHELHLKLAEKIKAKK